MLVLQVLYLFSPLVFAACVSALVLRFDLLRWARRPIDGGWEFGGRRLLGDSKTWRGVLVAVTGSIVAVAVQKHLLGTSVGALALVSYADLPVVAFGVAMGLGAMVGELPNSFVKRRLGIAPGKTTQGALRAVFYIWDQIDLLTGVWPLIACWVWPERRLVAVSVGLALVVHPTISWIGWMLGARRSAR